MMPLREQAAAPPGRMPRELADRCVEPAGKDLLRALEVRLPQSPAQIPIRGLGLLSGRTLIAGARRGTFEANDYRLIQSSESLMPSEEVLSEYPGYQRYYYGTGYGTRIAR